MRVMLPPTGRPAGSGFGPRIVAFIDSRPSQVARSEAVDLASSDLHWDADSVDSAYHRERQRQRRQQQRRPAAPAAPIRTPTAHPTRFVIDGCEVDYATFDDHRRELRDQRRGPRDA